MGKNSDKENYQWQRVVPKDKTDDRGQKQWMIDDKIDIKNNEHQQTDKTQGQQPT